MSQDGAAGSYYGRPVIARPVWKWEIPLYFFTGGLAGASSVLAFGAELTGRDALARRMWPLALAGVTACPALLISDLGRPERFLNMLRVIKPTSPMNVGAWALTAAGGAVTLATARSVLGWPDRPGRLAGAAAAALGLPVATYTAVLLSDTAVPSWHEARRELPFVFAASAMVSAGAAAVLVAPAAEAGPGRRLALLGGVAEGVSTQVMERRLGELAEPFTVGTAGRWRRAAQVLTTLGAAGLAVAGRRRRPLALGAAAAMLAGALCGRFYLFEAGFTAADDPRYTVELQRRRRAAARPAPAAAGASSAASSSV